MSNKENITPVIMKQNNTSDYSFLSCTEIFCEPLIESKQPQKQNNNIYHQQQMYPKLLQVKSQVDPSLVADNRVLSNLIRMESRYLPKYPNYFKTVQVEVKPHMRKIVSDWMLEVCQDSAQVFLTSVQYLDNVLSQLSVSPGQLQCVASACISLASKLHHPRPVSLHQLVVEAACSFTLREIQNMEMLGEINDQ